MLPHAAGKPVALHVGWPAGSQAQLPASFQPEWSVGMTPVRGMTPAHGDYPRPEAVMQDPFRE